jgi:hypothetical protein
MEKVSVSRGLLVGLAVVAAGALLAVAFLLGRTSGAGHSSAPVVERAAEIRVAAPAGAEARTADAEPRAADPPSQPPTMPAVQVPAAASSPFAPAIAPATPGPAEEPAIAAPDPARAGVAAYLEAVDRVHPGELSGGAEDFANEMAVALAKGDSSGLDDMIRQSEAARERLAALAAPVSCAAHHRESLGSLDEGLEVLRSLKAAMDSPDPASQLATVAARATNLRSRAEALQKEEQDLRRRYGLSR